MSIIDCSDYNSDMCPKSKINSADVINNIEKNSISFITFGCWGVYCMDGNITFPKGRKVTGGKSVANGVIKLSKKKNIDFINVSGDNIYARPLELEESYNCDERCKPSIWGKYDKRRGPKFHIDRQLEEGFNQCFKEIKGDTKFYIGIGNHDIEDCNVINTQLRYNNPKWIMPGTYYSVSHIASQGRLKLRLIYMDTNLYFLNMGKPTFCSKQEEPTPTKEQMDAKNIQYEWLDKQMEDATSNDEIIILNGHIPIQCNNHKFDLEKFKKSIKKQKEQGVLLPNFATENYSHELEKDITSLYQKYRIALYICADTHNKQIILGNQNLPTQLIVGSGGTNLDKVLIDSRTNIGKRTIFHSATYGFCNISINIKKDIQIDVYQTTNDILLKEYSITLKRYDDQNQSVPSRITSQDIESKYEHQNIVGLPDFVTRTPTL